MSQACLKWQLTFCCLASSLRTAESPLAILTSSFVRRSTTPAAAR